MKNKMINGFNKSSSIFIATFSLYENMKRLPANGMVEPMLSYFLPRAKKVLLLDEPHPISDLINPFIEIYNRGKLTKKILIPTLAFFPIYLLCKIPSKATERIPYKLRDWFAFVYILVTQRMRFDLFIGFEAINAFAGIILKKLGIIKTVVYYVSDYSPTRYGKTLLNYLYIRLDFFCVKHADFTWDVSPAMREGRIEAGMAVNKMKRIIHVPNGLFPSQINPTRISDRSRDTIVYMGILDKEMGIDLTIEAFSLVLKEKPKSRLHIIGGTKRSIARIARIARELGAYKAIIFYGFLPPHEEMTRIIRHCYIGVAPYLRDKNLKRRYGDPGKIRSYLGCGLPIISTGLLWYAKYVVKMGAGLNCKDRPEDLAKAILKLFNNEELYRKCSENAIKLGKNNTWENSYSIAFSTMQRMLS